MSNGRFSRAQDGKEGEREDEGKGRTGLGGGEGGSSSGGDAGGGSRDLPVRNGSLNGVGLSSSGESLGGGDALKVALHLFGVAVLCEVGDQVSSSYNGRGGGRKERTKNMSTMTGHASGVRATVPRIRRTSRARSHQIRPIECFDLLLVGMATSTKLRGESVSQRAMTGMLT